MHTNLLPSFPFYPIPEETLSSRTKGRHLDFSENLRIYHINSIDELSTEEICSRVLISKSTVERVIKDFENSHRMLSIFPSIRWKRAIRYPVVQDCIKDYIQDRLECFTAVDLKSHIKSKRNIDIPVHQIRFHLKSACNLSYKRGASRPIKLDAKREALLKQLFCLKLAKRLQDTKL